jgi:Flp pilus assembly CpaE family ATPase
MAAPAAPRRSVALLLRAGEFEAVSQELASAGFEPVPVADAAQLLAIAAQDQDLALVVIDLDGRADRGLDAWNQLRASGSPLDALLLVSPATLDRLDPETMSHDGDEYLTRPCSAESIRWRVEAMGIRSEAVDDGSGPVLQTPMGGTGWARHGQLLVVFSPKGGVGKTTLATNLGAALARRDQRVLLVDGDTVSGHVMSSLGMGIARTVAEAWIDEAAGEQAITFEELAASHASGLKVVELAAGPLHAEILEPGRLLAAVLAERHRVDFVIVDLHPEYTPVNRVLLEHADRILVPVTPDIPAIRAAIQLRDIADDLGFRERLALVVNRAKSGVSSGDVERMVQVPVFAHVRSAGLVLVQAANEGRTVVELAPDEKVSQDFNQLAGRILGVTEAEPVAKQPLRLFGYTLAART